MNRKRRAGRNLALVAVVGLSASLAAPAMATESAKPAEWGPCPEDVVAAAAPYPLECATIQVPLDYADPEGTQIDLMLSKHASTNPEKRRGVLLLNPGGPGGSGLTLSTLLLSRGLPSGVTDSYDLIGMDTRGVGHSSRVSCGFTAAGPYQGNLPPYPVDDAAVLRQAEVAKGVAEQCAKNDKDGRLRHLTTANTARDLDRTRAALGEEKASYLGYSYGSGLGAAYASMFPDRADRVVLDSNIGAPFLDRDGLRRYGLGTEETFPDFAKWVAERHEAYGLGRTPEEVRETYFEIAGKLDKQPVNGLDGSLFRLTTFGGLFNEASYGKTASTWQSVRHAVPAPTPPPPADQPHPADNFQSVFLSVTCNDVDWPEDVETYRRGVAEDRERYPLYGAAMANITPCAFWPHEPAEPPVAVNDDGPLNVLIVQNERDASTPLLGGQIMREKFENRSRLLSIDGSGHGGYVLGTNACALNVTTSFLVDGKMPEDQRCAADQ
ncbi:alpha/beta hydrolase [Amycolatopsis sp. YIM 10]|uniref:alpha/beta hydrolase n=1 Tax=Amycolatopsis sp. YIM 10 TaxID=2653857 RepID=UPI001290250D|nr:alpha/beta hydrolase [Amycolatopsis sp. YIM 10]QFU86833.1 Tripeptidyl aminopeptidase precursor [Amycolatopsis sp. YIM 10]